MSKSERSAPRPVGANARIPFRAHFADGRKLDFYADDIAEARWKVRPMVNDHGPVLKIKRIR